MDRAARGDHSYIFVASRPPGHHAGPRGPVPSRFFFANPSTCSNGFCLFNAVAVGAAYARCMYGREGGPFQRVAVLDFDVHHGNGTEEIIRCLTPQTRAHPLPPGCPQVRPTARAGRQQLGRQESGRQAGSPSSGRADSMLNGEAVTHSLFVCLPVCGWGVCSCGTTSTSRGWTRATPSTCSSPPCTSPMGPTSTHAGTRGHIPPTTHRLTTSPSRALPSSPLAACLTDSWCLVLLSVAGWLANGWLVPRQRLLL